MPLRKKKRRQAKRRRHFTERLKLYVRTHHPRAAKRARRMRSSAGRAMRKLRRLIRKRNRGLSGVNVTTTYGAPHWGGGNDIIEQFVSPFLAKYGLSVVSAKRTPEQNRAVGGSPTSDHLTTNTSTMACDYGTYSGESAARALAAAMGNRGWSPNSYSSFYIQVDGRTFRVQILWGAAIGHGDHIHVGVGLT